MSRGTISRSPYAQLALNDSHFAEVEAYDSSAAETVIPNGETWVIRLFVGASARLDDTTSKLVWDYGGTEEILAATHGDGSFVLGAELTGDGAKKLAIVLVNDTNAARVMGGQWEGERA